MNKFYAVFFLVITAGSTFSQVAFHKEFGTTACYDEGLSVVPHPDGYMATGHSKCGNSAWKGYLMKLSHEGDTIWKREMPSAHGKLFTLLNGQYLIAGGNKAGLAYDTIKISQVTGEGNLIWQTTLFYGVCKNTVHDVMEVSDGMIITGIYATQSCSNPVYNSFVTKLDFTGKIIWEVTVGGFYNDQLHALKIAADGDILAGGWGRSFTKNKDIDYMLVVVTPSGVLKNLMTYDLGGNDYAYDVEVIGNEVYMFGYGDNQTILKLNKDYSIIKRIELGKAAGGTYFRLQSTLDKGLGLLSYEDRDGVTTPVFGKTDTSGVYLWKHDFEGKIREFKENIDGSFILTGYDHYLPEMVVIKIDSTKFALPEIEDSTILDTVEQDSVFIPDGEADSMSTGIKEQGSGVLRVFPNPSAGDVYFELPQNVNDAVSIRIFDAAGRMVLYRENIGYHRFIIRSEALSAGIYTYLVESNQNRWAGKFIATE